MKTSNFLLLFLCLFFAFGCGLMDRLKSENNSSVNPPTPKPAETVAQATPSETPESSPTPFDKAALGRNLLAFGAGTIIVDKTSESEVSSDQARQLIDEASFGWMTAEGKIENQSVTLELPARTTLKTLVFDTDQPTYYDGRSPKDIIIEVSDTSATEGFQTILETTLKDSKSKSGVDDQVFPVSKEIAGRFLRYTVKNNYGSPQRIYTIEIYGYGDQEPRPAVPNVSGTYKIDWVQELHLKQEGNSVIGCYRENGGIVEGTIDGRNISLASTENGKEAQFASINVVDGGKKLLTTWWSRSDVKKAYDRFSPGDKISDKIGNCPHFPDLDGVQDAAKVQIEQSLEKTGRATLRGLNFDFNSDVLKSESKPTLEKLVAILKEKPDWKLDVEGHTDNVGGEAFNQTLSEKRSAAVKNYLTSAGIDSARLTSSGMGLSKPLTGNETEAGRAQNRRVELVKN